MRAEPLVSVIVPTHRRPAALDACLGALTQQSVGTDRFDVVVVDDGTPEPLEGVLDRHSSSLRLTVHRQASSGPASARNAGVAHARGRLLAFTDDDCLPSANWLEALVGALRRWPGSIVGGRTVNALTANPYAEASQTLLAYLYADGSGRADGLTFVASSNLGVARGEFEAVGGFAVSFPSAAAEDRDLCDRWKALGRAVRYEPAAVVRHAHVMGLGGFVRQHVEYGRGARRLHRARARRGQSPLRIEPPGFYGRMLRYPFQHLPARRAAPVACLIALSQAAAATGFLLESGRR